MAISISRNLLSPSIPLTGWKQTSRAGIFPAYASDFLPWQKTDSNPAAVAFRLIEELNNRNCFLRLCSRAIVGDARGPESLGRLGVQDQRKQLHAHPVVYICVYPILVYV